MKQDALDALEKRQAAEKEARNKLLKQRQTRRSPAQALLDLKQRRRRPRSRGRRTQVSGRGGVPREYNLTGCGPTHN